MLRVQDTFVQEYTPRGKDGSVWRKYAAVNLSEGGFIQVGYDAEQFHQMLNEFVVDVTKDRHVGTGGFVSHFGTSDADEVYARVLNGDEEAKLVWEALGYNIVKYIGSMATVMPGRSLAPLPGLP